MPIIVACSSCGSKLKVPDNYPARKARCGKCGGVVSLGADSPLAAVPSPRPRPDKPAESEEPVVGKRPGRKPEPRDESDEPVVVVPSGRKPVQPEPPAAAETDDVVEPELVDDDEVEAAPEERRPRRKKKRRKKRPAPDAGGSSAWIWWAAGCGGVLLLAVVGVVVAILAGYAEEVIGYGMVLGISVVVSTVILIISMIVASHFAGGIDFGEIHIVIPKALTLIFVVNLIGLIPVAGWVLPLPVWLFGLMYVFNLDFWESLFLVAINWILNLLFSYFLLAMILASLHRGTLDRGKDEPPVKRAAVSSPQHPGLRERTAHLAPRAGYSPQKG
jgi:hypothetical protein